MHSPYKFNIIHRFHLHTFLQDKNTVCPPNNVNFIFKKSSSLFFNCLHALNIS